MDRTRILIADDHSLVREGIASVLAHFDDVEVVGEAADGADAIDKVGALMPDVVLMDLSMPGLGGLEATIEIKKRHPNVRILVLSQYEDKEYVSRLLKAGVSGYILKRAVGGDLISAIRAVARGEHYLYPAIAASVIDGFVGKRNNSDGEDMYERLTGREKQILKLIAEGHSHKEMAGILGISVKTVISHQTNISEKLDIHSRAGFIKFAIRKGLIQIEA